MLRASFPLAGVCSELNSNAVLVCIRKASHAAMPVSVSVTVCCVIGIIRNVNQFFCQLNSVCVEHLTKCSVFVRFHLENTFSNEIRYEQMCLKQLKDGIDGETLIS